MINSELKSYCEGVISYHSKDYPYYVMTTNTIVSNNSYSNQYGATIYLSTNKPTVNSQFSFNSDEWLVITVYVQNANYNDYSPRVVVRSASGNITIDNWEYLYSNIESEYTFSAVQLYSPQPSYIADNGGVIGILQVCLLFVVVFGVWLRKR